MQDAVKGLHKEYLVAGADVITTNTFSCTQHSIEKVMLCAHEGFGRSCHETANLRATRTRSDKAMNVPASFGTRASIPLQAKLGDAQTEILEAACDICIDAIDEAKESGAARSDLVLLAGSLPPLK